MFFFLAKGFTFTSYGPGKNNRIRFGSEGRAISLSLEFGVHEYTTRGKERIHIRDLWTERAE